MADKPRDLKARGALLWADIADTWDLRADEIRILEHACRTSDELDRLQSELTKVDLVVLGSVGQWRPNPLTSEVRKHRELLAKLLRQLDLPDLEEPGHVEETSGSSGKSQRAQAAANARWSRVRALREGTDG